MSNIKYLKEQLYTSIDELISDYRSYLTDDKNYFSKERKLPLKTLIESILFMGVNAIKDELYDFFDFKDTPTTSAFVQQRQKLDFRAFKFLFESFTKKVYSAKNDFYKGYRLLAVDGSSIPISHNPDDSDTYMKHVDKYGELCKGHNAFHLTAMYDLISHLYIDVVIQGEANMNENGAFNEMVKRYEEIKAIFICDRCFESLNSFVHVMKKEQKFLIRVKDIGSNGLFIVTSQTGN